jgi:hypothetical protein
VSYAWRSRSDPRALTGLPAVHVGAYGLPVSATDIPLEELPAEERLTLREAAELLDRSPKAVEQLVNRGVLRVARERDEETGRTRRVWTSRAALEEYIARYARGRIELPPKPEDKLSPEERAMAERIEDPAQREAFEMILARTPEEEREAYDRIKARTRSPERQVIEDLSRENAELRLRVARLEQDLEQLRTGTRTQ